MTLGPLVRTVTRRATAERKGPLPHDEDQRRAGQRLQNYVLDLMARSGIPRVDGKDGLAARSGVSRGTIQAWFAGRPPLGATGGRVANVLGVSYMDLLNAREGRAPAATITLDELRALLAGPFGEELIESVLERLAAKEAERRSDEEPPR